MSVEIKGVAVIELEEKKVREYKETVLTSPLLYA